MRMRPLSWFLLGFVLSLLAGIATASPLQPTPAQRVAAHLSPDLVHSSEFP